MAQLNEFPTLYSQRGSLISGTDNVIAIYTNGYDNEGNPLWASMPTEKVKQLNGLMPEYEANMYAHTYDSVSDGDEEQVRHLLCKHSGFRVTEAIFIIERQSFGTTPERLEIESIRVMINYPESHVPHDDLVRNKNKNVPASKPVRKRRKRNSI